MLRCSISAATSASAVACNALARRHTSHPGRQSGIQISGLEVEVIRRVVNLKSNPLNAPLEIVADPGAVAIIPIFGCEQLGPTHVKVVQAFLHVHGQLYLLAMQCHSPIEVNQIGLKPLVNRIRTAKEVLEEHATLYALARRVWHQHQHHPYAYLESCGGGIDLSFA